MTSVPKLWPTHHQDMRQARKDFSWLGVVIEVHSIGPYCIVEYWYDPERFASSDPDRDMRRVKAFGAYIEGRNTSHSWNSLDEALAGCIAIRHKGPNCQAAYYFMHGIDADKDREYEKEA